MLSENFRSYNLAVQLYRQCKQIQAAHYFKDQLLRASLSISLNLAEGSAKPTRKDRLRFYSIAFASLREVQALIDADEICEVLRPPADILGAHLNRLTRQ